MELNPLQLRPDTTDPTLTQAFGFEWCTLNPDCISPRSSECTLHVDGVWSKMDIQRTRCLELMHLL